MNDGTYQSYRQSQSVMTWQGALWSPTDGTLSLQKNTTQSHKLRNDQGKTMIAKDSFVPLL